MPRVTEVVKQLLILNVLFFVATTMIFPQYFGYLAVYYPATDLFRPWQLVTHMFMHADFGHLFFNMFALFLFGSALESYWGGKRFLTFYLASGLGAVAIYLLVLHWEIGALPAAHQAALMARPTPMVGASGAVFGLLAGYGMMFPESKIMLLIPPIPIKAKYFVLIYGVLELIFGISGRNTGVAHFAHVGGAICGAALVYYWRKNRKV
ncbi:MAG: rhomboid family intramembrane serine protease [Saprospiraceae bacterium]|nr:rhomboid family intramembrane serine protease [Saprospiraceae bacterium]